MIERSIAYLLRHDPGVSSLVNQRVFPVKAPQRASQTATDRGAFPRILYQRISTRRVPSQGGQTGLAMARLQFTCQAETPDEAKLLADKVRLARQDGTRLDGWKQKQMGAVYVESVWLSDDRDGYDADQHAGDVGVHSVLMDAECWFQETTS